MNSVILFLVNSAAVASAFLVFAAASFSVSLQAGLKQRLRANWVYLRRILPHFLGGGGCFLAPSSRHSVELYVTGLMDVILFG